ncbi:hypothetical protein CALVIDRAFT_558300 [Calocera viscosa TUFC12733]|uniref:Uncharacterized protein n=1 Tax=Calocera viscosa (strain TUFC12733) TaxID=1330018 RepID=A0A167H3T0_CALVF|nr:hypothetical protein CALVIDRAFT_558300 [Calocera viscosa TUFC12733]
MFSVIATASILFVLVNTALSQNVSCVTYGAPSCPYPEATTADLQALISEFCGDNGGYPYYEYYEDIEASFPEEGYYQVTSGAPGQFSQATCNSALNYIVSECDATGEFWVTGIYETEGVTFSVTPCALA